MKILAEKKLVRLQKFLADCGVASRRKSEGYIQRGIVKVNGVVAQIGDTWFYTVTYTVESCLT